MLKFGRQFSAGFGIAAAFLFEAAVSGAVLEMNIQPTFAGEPVMPGSLRYKNDAGEVLSVTRLSYLLSGFAIQHDDGTWMDIPDLVAWLDVEKRRTVVQCGDIPLGHYRSIRFSVGLNPQLNESDPAKWPANHPMNPNLNGLHWSWQGGYIFMAFEGQFRTTNSAELTGFSFHFARDPNRQSITLPANFELKDDAAILVEFDLASLLNGPQPISFARDGTSTHSRPNDPILAKLRSNIGNAFRVHSVQSTEVQAPRSNAQPLYLPEKFTPYAFKMSESFPMPNLPGDNPLFVERIELGKKLFSENALSKSGNLSCASCHKQETAFADPRRVSIGEQGRTGKRNAMPLFNLAWKSSFFWDGRAASLREQALMPIQDHSEMDETISNIVKKLSNATNATVYPSLFAAAFGGEEITGEKIGLALEQYLLTLTSFDSRFDRTMRGETRLTAIEQRGFELFMAEYDPRMNSYGADCFHCHGGALFSDHHFHSNGLGTNAQDEGRFDVTKSEADRGKFATPSLRNVALTAPYMHDGRFATLEDVIAHYDHGIARTDTLDPNLAKHRGNGLHLSKSDQKALVAFLNTLTDEQYRAPAPVKHQAMN